MTSAETVVPNEVTFTGTKVSTSIYFKKKFIYLAVPGLSCDVRDLSVVAFGFFGLPWWLSDK